MKKNIIKHLTKGRSPNIVDISKKKETKRIAIAEGFIRFNKKTYNKIAKIKISKGEIINVSIISGIMASKKTHELIPLCHNIPIENVNININEGKLKLPEYKYTNVNNIIRDIICDNTGMCEC